MAQRQIRRRQTNEGIKDAFKKAKGLIPTHIGGTGYGGLSITNLPKDEMEKAHFIGYVKFLQDEMNKGHSMLGRGGKVTDEDIKNYDDYVAWYNEFVVNDEEDEYADDYEAEETYEESLKSVASINKALNEALTAFDDEKKKDNEHGENCDCEECKGKKADK